MAERKFKIGETVRNNTSGQLYRIVSVRSERRAPLCIEYGWWMESARRLRRKPICRRVAGAGREHRATGSRTRRSSLVFAPSGKGKRP
jgi:hypothetical protein